MVVGDGVPKVIVARSGYDLRTCDPRYLTIDSTKNQFKVWMIGSGIITIEAGETSNFRNGSVIQHGLDYQPQIISYIKNPKTGLWSITPTAFQSQSEDLLGYTTDARGDGEYVLWAYNYDLPTDTPHNELELEYFYVIFIEPRKDA